MRLEIANVCKKYSGRVILNTVSLALNSGEVLGFVGPNGAGKSTTMKIAMGLVHADSGELKANGASLASDKVAFLGHIGGLVDGPPMYPTLNARQHLEYVARMRGMNDSTRICEVLNLVGLSADSKKSVSRFSMGMKQRLGIAMAILHSPDFLILDEPTNGLDPAAMVEFRELMRTLKESNVGILISSHVLAEIERLCDRVAFIRDGSIVREIQIGQQGSTALFLVRTTDSELATRLLLACDAVASVSEGEEYLSVAADRDAVPSIAEVLIRGGVGLLELTPLRRTLEADYLQEFQAGKEILS